MAEYGFSVVGLIKAIESLFDVKDNMATLTESKYVVKAGGSGSDAPYAWFLEHGWHQAGNFYKYPFMKPARDDIIKGRLSQVLEDFNSKKSLLVDDDYGDALLKFIAEAVAARARARVDKGIGGKPQTRSGDLVASIRVEKKE